jgi:hypothetical protein
MLLSYLREDCHKQAVTHIRESRRFESMYTLQGKPNQHATRFPRSIRVWPRTICLSRGPHIATFHAAVNRFEQIHCTREEGLPTQSTARRPSDPRVRTQLLSHKQPKSSGEKSTPVDNWLLGLPGPYHRHAIGTFNACSRGPTERSSIDTGGGYNLRGAGLPHTHSPTFPTSCPHFPLMVPPGLHFNHILSKTKELRLLRTYGRHVIFRPLGHLP